jgi:hypothetical protein
VCSAINYINLLIFFFVFILYDKYLKKNIIGGTFINVYRGVGYKIDHDSGNKPYFRSEIENLKNNICRMKSGTILGHNELPFIPFGYIIKTSLENLCNSFCLYDCSTGFSKSDNIKCDDISFEFNQEYVYKNYEKFIENIPSLDKSMGNLTGTRKYNEVIIKNINIDIIDTLVFVQYGQNGDPLSDGEMHWILRFIVEFQNSLFEIFGKIIKISEYVPQTNEIKLVSDKLINKNIMNDMIFLEIKKRANSFFVFRHYEDYDEWQINDFFRYLTEYNDEEYKSVMTRLTQLIKYNKKFMRIVEKYSDKILESDKIMLSSLNNTEQYNSDTTIKFKSIIDNYKLE